MKSFLIMFLIVALAAAAFVTRPSEESLQAFVSDRRQPVASRPRPIAVHVKNAILKAADEGDSFVPPGCEFHDRILWVEVEKDGRTLYTGAFAHWFKHDVSSKSGTRKDSDVRADLSSVYDDR